MYQFQFKLEEGEEDFIGKEKSASMRLIFLYTIHMASGDFIILKGIEFEIPNKNNFRKWDYREWNEGKKKFKSYWLDTYEKDGCGIGIHSYQIISENGSKFYLDDKKLRGEEVDIAKVIFKELGI